MSLAAGTWVRYRVGGRSVALNVAVPELAPYVDVDTADARAAPAPPVSATGNRVWTVEVEALIGGVLRRVVVQHRPEGSSLDVVGVVSLRVPTDGSVVELVSAAADAASAILVESLLGPGLILALARQGTFCLHASAIAWASGAVAFVGSSGAGKSTLAELLAGSTPRPRVRLGDDILPVTVQGAEVTVQPDFPQLKLAPEHQAVSTVGPRPRFPLVAVYHLAEPDPAAPDRVTVRSLTPRAAVIVLLAQTVAARLFPPALAESHFDDCVTIASRIPIRRLCYPRRYDIAPAVAAAVANDLRRLGCAD